MAMLNEYQMSFNDRNFNDDDEKDEITSITANNLTERAHSIIDDDVGSINNESNLDYVPVKENQNNKTFKSTIIPESIEIVDVYSNSRLNQDESECQREHNKMQWRTEVDRYDLEHRNYRSPSDNEGCSDDTFQTVIKRPQPFVTLTRHEPHYHEQTLPNREHCHTESRMMHQSPIHELDNMCRHSISDDSTDIGRQISQLAQRIKSLGNISRVYEASPITGQDCSCVHTHHVDCPMICQDVGIAEQLSMKTARKLDKVERLQKRQEAMQSRLTDLAKKLSDSTRDLSRSGLYNENMSNDENFHSVLPKTARKAIKKSVRKGGKNAKKPSSVFLRNILNDIGDAKSGEAPLKSSSYCLPHASSTGSPESVVTDATGKYLNDELNNIRHEFRTQVEEIKRLLSDRYQQSANVNHVQEKVIPHATESLADQIERSMSRVHRDTSPSLRNITNVRRDVDQSCPLDKYLKRRPLDSELPSLESDITPSLRPGILPSVAKAIKSKQRMLSDPVEAERFLVELRNRRANLENNISSLERAKEGQLLFSILEKLQGNESSFEVARIQAMVDDAIASMNPEIQWEVKQEYQSWLEKRRQRQVQRELDDEAEHSGKVKHIKSTKIVQHVNYNQLPSTYATPQKPWLCKKYWEVRSKIDTGLRKAERPVSKIARPVSPTKPVVSAHQEGRSTWCNRRRYRTPYLHFVNDIKLAKKSIGPLSDRQIPILGVSPKSRTIETTEYKRMIPSDNLVLLGVRQYSLNYHEEEKVEKPMTMARAVSPKSESKRSSVLSSHSVSVTCNEKGKHSTPVQLAPKPRPATPPSPSLSEIGTGINLQSRKSSKPREERVGPFRAIDPLEEARMASRPINVTFHQPERQIREPDINSLRQMIERAIYDQIEIPSPTTSTDLTLSVPKTSFISTPLPSECNHYSEDFGSESPRERTDHSITFVDGIRTPNITLISSDQDHRLSTPLSSPTRSMKASPKRQIICDKVSEAVQTISDKANQTIEDKEMQTNAPIQTQTSKEQRPSESVESFSTTSGLEGSLTDTQAEPWSDGMWLLDRSEGEMAEHYLQPVSRWNLGSCPENPTWPHGTDDLVRLERQSTQSFGEFIKPTLPGLVPTVDGVLQLKTLPLRQKYNSIDADESEFDQNSDRRSSAPNFKLIRMSRDSKSKLTTPRSVFRSPRHSPQNSDGEVDLGPEYDEKEDYGIVKKHGKGSNKMYRPSDHTSNVPRSNDSYNNSPQHAQNRASDECFHPISVRQSNESNQTDLTGPFRESYSDRMNIDPMKYLRGSKQSQSEFSDTGGLMSTGQVIAAAFRGGDSADFDGYDDHFQDGNTHYQPLNKDSMNRMKQTVRIPTIESNDQSERSHSDLSEIILQ